MSLWRETYKIGIEQIDLQHKQLLLMTEEFLAAVSAPPPNAKAQYQQMLDFLERYTLVHFSAEEIYMQRVGYAGCAAHKALHQAFCEDLRGHKLRLIQQEFDNATAKELANMLTRWWIYHIMREDKKLAGAGDGL